jgi:hypothetical protein
MAATLASPVPLSFMSKPQNNVRLVRTFLTEPELPTEHANITRVFSKASRRDTRVAAVYKVKIIGPEGKVRARGRRGGAFSLVCPLRKAIYGLNEPR